MAETITAKITAVSQKGDGFKVTGYENWFNLSNDYQGVAIPPVGTEIEFTYKPWLNPKSHKTAYYVDEIILVTQVAAPAPTQGASYAGMQPPAATAPAASTPAPTPAPVAQAPRNGPEPAWNAPGSFAYKDTVAIPKQVALKTAIELVVGVYGGTAGDVKDTRELETLALNAMVVAEQFYEHFLNNSEVRGADVAMPDDTLVPTPTEMGGDPGPQEQRG